MMSDRDAADRVAVLREHFKADFSAAIGATLKSEFQNYDAAVVDEAIRRYVLQHDALRVAPLLNGVRELAPKRNQALRDAEAWKRQRSAEEAESDPVIGKLSPTQLKRELKKVVGKLPAASRPFFEKCDPAHSDMARKLIFNHLRPRQQRPGEEARKGASSPG